MKALLLEDVRKISIKDHPEPTKKNDHMISKVNANGTFDVKWDDGTTQPGTAASSVRLKAGTAVEARWNGGSYWSGKVTKANSNGTYDITWDSDGTMQKNTPLGDLKLK